MHVWCMSAHACHMHACWGEIGWESELEAVERVASRTLCRWMMELVSELVRSALMTHQRHSSHSGLSLCVVSQHGKTALMWSSENGHLEIVQYLLAAGVYKESTDKVRGR